MKGLVLSLFPGADIFGQAFEMEGWCVVRGPDLILGQDIRNWKSIAGKFDGIIGGPPCQMFSDAVKGQTASHGNLIPEFERIVKESRPTWFVMENVPAAPIIPEAQWSEVVDAWEFGSSQHRVRKFSSNLQLELQKIPSEERHKDPWPCITATEYKFSPGKTGRRRASRKVGRVMTLDEMKEGFGLPKDYDMPCLLSKYKYSVIGNGVPMIMGRAVAKAVWKAINQ